jgi:hypothetical protein
MLVRLGERWRMQESQSDVAANELVELAEVGRLDQFGERVADLLTAGKLSSVGPALASMPRPPLAIQVLLADLRARVLGVEMYDLAELDRRVRSEHPDSDLAGWMIAILTEWGLWKGDLSTTGYGHTSVILGSSRSRLALISEARRLRIETLSSALIDPGSARSLDLACEVGSLLNEAGCTEELAFTDIVLGYGALAITDDRSVEPLNMLRRGCDVLARLGADRLGFGLACLSWSEYMMGNLTGAETALARYDALEPNAPLPPLIVEGSEMLRALLRLARGGEQGPLVSSIAHHFDRLRQAAVPPWFGAPVANDLLDIGDTDLASTVVATVGAAVSFVRPAHQAVREVECRLRVLADDPDAIDDLWALYEEWASEGRMRRAAASAVRCSWTAQRAGMFDAADALFQWGLERLPADDGRTEWERASIKGWRSGPVRRTTGDDSLIALAPDLYVVRDGRRIQPGDVQAKLLALLAAVHRPVTTDWIVTALWSDVDLDSGRNRLAAVLHRLRQRLDLAPDELIRRTRHGIELVDTGWDVDVWRFAKLSWGDADERRAAIELYGADLVARQFAYDDLLDDHRARLRDRLLETIRSLVDEQELSEIDALALTQRLGIDELTPIDD